MSYDDLTKAWIEGLAMADAWFLLGETAHKEHYRDAGPNLQLTRFLEATMQSDLVGSLLLGAMRATGVRVEPTIGAVPELVPVHLFADRQFVDWQTSEVCSAGQRFESVRVVIDDSLRALMFPRAKISIQPVLETQIVDPCEIHAEYFDAEEPDPSLISENADEVGERADADATLIELSSDRPTKFGRPSNNGELVEVIRNLITGSDFSFMPRKEQIARVQERARKVYPTIFISKGSPSRPSIVRALTQLGLSRAREKK